jgi:gliding motility-associated lipoprotein GldH
MRPLLYVLIFFSLLSCGNNHFYTGKGRIPDTGWSGIDTLTYSVDIGDTLARYDIILDVEHSTGFEFQNLYIQIRTFFPDGKSLSQTLPIDFADQSGRWHGRCGGSNCQLKVILQENARFDQTGIHTFKIIPYMRVDPVSGVGGIDLILDKHEV